MDIFGKDFGVWVTLDRYGNVGPDMDGIAAFIQSEDCSEFHFNYIMGESL